MPPQWGIDDQVIAVKGWDRCENVVRPAKGVPVAVSKHIKDVSPALAERIESPRNFVIHNFVGKAHAAQWAW